MPTRASDSLLNDATIKVVRRTGYAPTVTPDSIEPIASEPVPKDEDFKDRYSARDLLGEGGMGEVRLTRDTRIGREVAMKVVRPGAGSRSDMRSRFLREARVQGQLEHPAVVPVYDLGARPDGAAYFTMKRVRGKTLEEIIDGLHAREPAMIAEFSRRKLLTAFNSVCLAIDFAHARGVVHRDLKPGNVMLGGFGEVYVLDWGLAKIKGDIEPESGRTAASPEEPVDAPLSVRGQTEDGAVMGTPGFMAPEQLVSTDVDGRADVYALGAMLFEICTLKPLHDKPKLSAVLDSTLRGPETRASIRAPELDLPPELEAIWTKATALKREDRYETARALTEDLERFLDGDRDLEQRKKMADGHAERGEQAVERACQEGKLDDRRDAMQELGRALALDPSNRRALAAMGKLLAEPPKELPAEAEEQLVAANDRSLKVAGRVASFAYASWFLFFPFTYFMGFREAWLSGVMAVLIAGAVGSSIYMSMKKTRNERARFFAVIFSMAAIAVSSRIFGPFMLVPALVLANTVGFTLTRHRRDRVLVAILGSATIGVPFLLEELGILSPSYVLQNGRFEIVPHIVSFDHTGWTLALLIITHIGIVIAAVGYVGTMRDHLKRHERRALMQSWHFRQLAPKDADVGDDAAVSERGHECMVSEIRSEVKALRSSG